jgi:uncharacterized protein
MPEKNLQVLLSSIKPRLRDEQFVFCSVLELEFKKLTINPICIFHEDEGISLIVAKSDADSASLKYDGTWSLITCEVNSDLNAVGFIAAMSKMISDAGISVNTVSAFHHDHLFVPTDRVEEVMLLLQEPPQKPAPKRDPIDNIRELIPMIFSEHRAHKALGSLLSQGHALITSKFGEPLPPDMRIFYERCSDVKIFNRYSILSLQKAIDVDRSQLPSGLIAIDLSEPNGVYPIIDLDCGDFDYIVIALSFTEFIDKILAYGQDSNYWNDHNEQYGNAKVHLKNSQVRKKYEEYWDSLGPETGSQRCMANGCENKNVKLSVFCRQHQFEQVHKVPCPFTSDAPADTLAEYELKE